MSVWIHTRILLLLRLRMPRAEAAFYGEIANTLTALSKLMKKVSSDGQADRQAHSLHAYFLQPGNIHKHVLFYIDPIRDGGSFSTRRVVAKQEDQAIFNTSISYKVPEGGIVEHQPNMPKVPPP